MKQKLEEAAKQYAESVIDSFGTNGIPNGVSDIKEMIALGFENGTSWLSSQIKSIILDDTLTDGEVIDNINELLKPTRMYWSGLKGKEIKYEKDCTVGRI